MTGRGGKVLVEQKQKKGAETETAPSTFPPTQ